MASLRSWERETERVFACALLIERLAAWRLGQTMLVGIGCKRRKPKRPVISFGFAGALRNDLPIASKTYATKVVDENRTTLWEDAPLKVHDAHPAVILAVNRIINSAEERQDLRSDTKADIVDMESGIYARDKMFVGGLRVISDTPTQPLGSLPVLWFGAPALWALASITF
jgi:nucleoside phosphorylase